MARDKRLPRQVGREGQPQAGTRSRDRHQAFEVMHDIGHGRIEDLGVTGGVPHVTARTKLFRRVRLDRPDLPTAPGPDHTNHRPPHPQHERLLAYCRRVRDGVIRRVEVADGLPVHKRRLLNLLTALSLLICVVAVIMWVRSYWRLDIITIPSAGEEMSVSSYSGQLGFTQVAPVGPVRELGWAWFRVDPMSASASTLGSSAVSRR